MFIIHGRVETLLKTNLNVLDILKPVLYVKSKRIH